MADAAAPRPICGDRCASRFVDEEARRIWERFKGFKSPNASNAARHRIIDELVQEKRSPQRHARVVVIGAGFDTRAYLHLPARRGDGRDERARRVHDSPAPALRTRGLSGVEVRAGGAWRVGATGRVQLEAACSPWRRTASSTGL
ncbi:class I SAM-dependent methyltransferase [Hyalangium sp.]|uniref:class I SAM-dependent methyltransferase n=1 Tax=Hyalangium sp. TaxID=2028555 RepID=UPI0039C89BFC